MPSRARRICESAVSKFFKVNVPAKQYKQHVREKWRDIFSSTPFIGTHFGRPCLSVHGSGLVFHGSGGNRSRPSDMDFAKSVFMSGASRPASSSLRGPSPQALILRGGGKVYRRALETTLFRGMPTGPEAFLEPPGVSGLRSSAGPT